MNKLIIGTLTVLLSFSYFAQDESSTNCSKRDRFKNQQLKSNALSVSQIVETEKYDVHFYALDVAMTNLTTSIDGTAEIHATARQTLDSALFELFNTLAITAIRVDGSPVQFSRNLSAVKAPVNKVAGESFVLSIDYNGTPPDATTNPLGGAGMTNDNSPSWGNQVTWSLSEPFSAYEWWPCKQSLKDKADSCEVKITVPNTCKAGSNGLLKNVVDLGNGTSRYEWKHRHPIDYYLISVAVAKYVEYNVYANPVGSTNPVLIQNFIYDNPATLNNFQADIDETADFLELFSELFGLYPFADEKYGHCMAPISGGMEHQTMTTQGFFEKSLTAHELGHQWFGDNVTCASWADIWVNEGFASYSEQLMLENLYPAEAAQNMLNVHDNVKSQPNGSVYVLDSLNEGRIFSSRLTYDKGSAIVHTMRFVLNNDTQFFQALKNFQQDFGDSVAIGTDIQHALEAESGLDLSNLFSEWYFGQGYPTYSTKWNTISGKLHLKINHTTSTAVTPLFTNPIEIKFSRSGMPDTTIRFDIQSNSENFIIPAAGTITGVAAVDPNNWVVNDAGNNIYDPNFLASLEETNLPNQICIFPNPSRDKVKIDFTIDGDYELLISDIQGKEILRGSCNKEITIDVSALSKGTYLILLSDKSKGLLKKEKLIVE
jgi:aminopeptidase N